MKKLLMLVLSVVSCEIVGVAGTAFTIAAIPTWYASLAKPFFSPPNWIFGPVWTILYFLMGVSFYLIWTKGFAKNPNKTAAKFFIAQLFFNFLWSFLFFGLKSPLLGLLGILILWFLIVATMRFFYPISKTAFYLLCPYIVWVSFATLLNAAIALLN